MAYVVRFPINWNPTKSPLVGFNGGGEEAECAYSERHEAGFAELHIV
jgi:hypothetical protein